MSLVPLVSGGLDSTLMTLLAIECGQEVAPLFIDYGQLSVEKELDACKRSFVKLGIPEPEVVSVPDIGRLLPSGLTNRNLKVFEDAFLPGRNLFFLLFGASYAYKINAGAIAIGLLDENSSIFPDQTKNFTLSAEKVISEALGVDISIRTPLINFTKSDVVTMAKIKGIDNTYSCHAGTDEPCGLCIACRELDLKEV